MTHETDEQREARWQSEDLASERQRHFETVTNFVGYFSNAIYTTGKNPQLVEVVNGRILSTPTCFEATIELKRTAKRVLGKLEYAVFYALTEGRISEEQVTPSRLESIRNKCLSEWKRVGLLPLNTFLNVSQAVLDERHAEDERESKRQQDRRNAKRIEQERQERIFKAKLLRMRPRDRERALAQTEMIEKENAA
jgi:hypothetical protein